MNTPETVIFSDASANKSNLGAAVAVFDQHNNIQRFRQISISVAKHWSVHAAEPSTVCHAVDMVESVHLENNLEPSSQDQTFTIVSDSKSALQAIANPVNKSGQHIVHSILKPHGTT